MLTVPETLTLLAGDFDSVSPYDPEPEGSEALAALHRIRYLADDMLTADRSVLTHLEAGGWVDVDHALDGLSTRTAPTSCFTDTGLANMRCNYMFTTNVLAAHAQSYRVTHDDTTERASDHYLVVAIFGISQ